MESKNTPWESGPILVLMVMGVSLQSAPNGVPDPSSHMLPWRSEQSEQSEQKKLCVEVSPPPLNILHLDAHFAHLLTSS